MWTATLTKKEEVNGILSLEVTFSNGTKSITESVRSSSEYDIRQWVKHRKAEFEKAEALESSLTEGVEIEELPDEMVTPPTPTAKDVFWQNVVKFERLNRLVELGVVPDTALATPLNKLQTDFRANFIG